MGLAHEDDGVMAVANFESASHEVSTTIHEMGHLFGAPDHYNPDDTAFYNRKATLGGFEDECIYGSKHNEHDIVSSGTICPGCQATIRGEQNVKEITKELKGEVS